MFEFLVLESESIKSVARHFDSEYVLFAPVYVRTPRGVRGNHNLLIFLNDESAQQQKSLVASLLVARLAIQIFALFVASLLMASLEAYPSYLQ